MALNNLTKITSSGLSASENFSVSNVNASGIITASSFSGDGSGLTGIVAAGSGVVVQEEGSTVGTAQTINFIGTGVTATFSGGIASVEITTGSGGGVSDIVDDTTPQLGGNLDLNSKTITGTGGINITGVVTATSFIGNVTGTSSTATNITVADESSDTSCFVLYSTEASGNIAPKTGSNLTFNSSTGTLTASTFVGDGSGLTGIVASGSGVVIKDDGSLVGTAGTIDFGANVSVSPISAGVVTVTASAGTIAGINTLATSYFTHLDVAGVSTFTGSIDANGNLDVDGHTDLDNVTIAGVVTATTLVKSGGTSSQFLKADGTVDSSTYLTSYTETDPVVAAVNGIVKSNGSTISAATAGTDYLAPTGDGSSLTGIGTAFTNVQATWSLGANGTSAYLFTGPGNDGTEDNPDIYLVRGQKYRFTNNSGGAHPFEIRSSAGGSAYSDGVTNNNAASGNIEINVQHDAPARLFYQCSSHSGMVGNIYIVGGSDWRMTDVNTSTDPEIYTDRYVGIGTDNPLMALHVHGAANSADSRIRLSSAEGSGLTIRAQSATENNINADGGEHITFSRGNVESLRINSSGNIGIGTVPQSWSGFRSLQLGGTTSIWSVEGGQAGSSFYSNNIYYDGSNRRYLTSNAASEYIQDASTGNHIFYGVSSGTAGNTLSGYTEVARFTSSGLKLPSGLGIDFSAASGSAAGSSSALLDDYEEGTWTPTAVNYSGTMQVNSASYVKAGNLCYIHAYVGFDGTTDGDDIRIDGLPFTPNGINNNYYLISAHTNGGLEELHLRAQGTTTQMAAVHLSSGNGDAKPSYTALASKFIIFGGCYRTT